MTRILTLTLNPALDISTETETVAPEHKLRCAAPRTDPGGGGVNVSRALANLGGASVPLVAAGGPVGAHLLTLLCEAGLRPVDVGAPGDTRQSLAVRELATGMQYRFVMPGPQWDDEDAERVRAAVALAVAPGDLLVVSGSPPPGLAADFFVTMNDRLAPRGVRVILDTSGPALAAAAGAARPFHVLRMDDDEAEALAGGPVRDVAAAAAFAASLVARGAAQIVAVAQGASGTAVADASGRWHCAPPTVTVVSKVGAGDSFVAGFALALSRGEGVAQACALGVAAAAAAVTTPDTQLCDCAVTTALRAQVVTTRL